ncbi:PAS modulated sigma54 specific transcriptional regulator, Fis family [Caldalkalibacillus thermarum TA2.A1]|uniref:HTH-type transcriptional regulatory protein TyrR n=1 Tax=Caldalkalibacillus thermarum (strain TA2.A1) TaxID=986075 RepID=F5L5X2_CALTT|nr:sigma 54-interacting transcriptional regulator [Caldalkalibacillus thermarum]EGL83245.1 PAS modulated sigma54 specific transcriptional regulator, Fis family [Caldalkalibacillus thermarum TA2.A1]QZT33582.1 sigma 54-interacting transcriptional regulator [Caldalkalibacillus thermarum TA2.A1]
MFLRVKDAMIRTNFRFYTDDLIVEAAHYFTQHQLKGALVFNDHQQLVGMIDELALINGLAQGSKTIKQVMIPCAHSLYEHALIRDIIDRAESILPVKNEREQVTGYTTRTLLLEKYKEEVQEQLSHLDAIFNSAHNGILSIDERGYITSINPAAEKMAGTTKEKALGRPLNEVVVPSGLLEVVKTGKPHTEKYQVGNRKYITNRTPIFKGGKVVGAVGVFQDISEIEFISQELSSVKNLLYELDTVLESSYDAIVITDEHGAIIRTNKALCRMLGLDDRPCHYNELTGKCLHYSIVSLVKEKDSTVTVIERNHTKNNLLMITGTPVRVKGKIKRIVINMRDITELDNLRRELDETKRYIHQLEEKTQGHQFVAHSEAMKKVLENIHQIAKVDSTVLILGESGVGKEEIANLLHRLSPRSQYKFVKINCGAIPEQLLESELFGYEAGAFTGAHRKGKTGLFEVAHKGTIFLDEIGELPLQLQVKLLRVLQEKEIIPLGGVRPKKIDVRIIAATNKDLEALVKEGHFREDLFYRLNVVPVKVPPLRERIEDIPLLVKIFQQKFNSQYHMDKSFSEEAIQLLTQYHWPGNVRELINMVERLIVTVSSPVITKQDVEHVLDLRSADSDHKLIRVNGLMPLKEAVDEVEKQLIKKALQVCRNTRGMARLLQVNQSTIVRKMHKFRDVDWQKEVRG